VKIDDAIVRYVEYKTVNGFLFSRAAMTLYHFRRRTGNIDLCNVTTQQVLDFLNGPRTGTRMYRQNHSLLRRFFDYAAARDWIPEFRMPQNRPYERVRFVPYVYSGDEVGRLIQTARTMSPVGLAVLPRTFADVILTLYATGASVNDVYGLRCDDIDFENAAIRFGPRRISRTRKLPIGKDLLAVLRRYKRWREMRQVTSAYFFARKDGGRLNVSSAVNATF
jgi:integrase